MTSVPIMPIHCPAPAQPQAAVCGSCHASLRTHILLCVIIVPRGPQMAGEWQMAWMASWQQHLKCGVAMVIICSLPCPAGRRMERASTWRQSVGRLVFVVDADRLPSVYVQPIAEIFSSSTSNPCGSSCPPRPCRP